MTRILVHRLMAVFLHVKHECERPLKSRKATVSEANDHGKELHRRSRVSKAPPGYVLQLWHGYHALMWFLYVPVLLLLLLSVVGVDGPFVWRGIDW